MACAACGRDRKTRSENCDLCGKPHDFCPICIKGVASSKKAAETASSKGEKKKPRKLASIVCRMKSGELTNRQAEAILEKAKTANKQDAKRSIAGTKKCVKKAPKTPKDAVIDATALGPSDPKDIAADPMKYVHIRANEIWKANPKLFDNTTACVTIIECGAEKTRGVILTSSVEGPNPLAELTRQAKDGELLIPPDPIVHRVRHKLTSEEKKKDAKKPKDSVFIARNAAANPAKQADIDKNPDYTSAEASMSKLDPKYTVVGTFPSADKNETHAEQRAYAFANAKGCTVIAQAPTLGCCGECRKDLGSQGLAKVPVQRQSSSSYNTYRSKTLRPTLAASKK
jgi:hypothetical protein